MSYFTNYDIIFKDDRKKEHRGEVCFSSLNYGDYLQKCKEIDVYIPNNIDNSETGYYKKAIYLLGKEKLTKYIKYLSEGELPIELIDEEEVIINSNHKGFRIKFKLNNYSHIQNLLILTIIRYAYETKDERNTNKGKYFDKLVDNFIELCENIKEVDYHKLLILAEQSVNNTLGINHDGLSMNHRIKSYYPITWKERLENTKTTVNNSTILPDNKNEIIGSHPNKDLNTLIEDKNWNKIIELYKLK